MELDELLESSGPISPSDAGRLIDAGADALDAGDAELGRLLDGCRNYLLLIARQEWPDDLRAKEGPSDLVQQALAEAGLSLPPGWMIESAPNRLEAAARTDELFADGHRPSAAVCYNDTVALGLMLGLNSRGIRPGGDFAVTGFDDISEASVAVPPLTTLTADPRERGRQAAALLLQRLDEPDAPPRRTVAPVQLRIRESSAARPN